MEKLDARMGPKVPKMGIALEVAGTPVSEKKIVPSKRQRGLPLTMPIFRPASLSWSAARRHDLPDIEGACRSPDSITDFGDEELRPSLLLLGAHSNGFVTAMAKCRVP